MTYYAVIDTNVIVSSMIKSNSIPGKIIQLIKRNIIVPLLNEEIVEEYVAVQTRNEFNFDSQTVEETITAINKKGIILKREQTLEDFIDKDDIVFFENSMALAQTVKSVLNKSKNFCKGRGGETLVIFKA